MKYLSHEDLQTCLQVLRAIANLCIDHGNSMWKKINWVVVSINIRFDALSFCFIHLFI